MAIKIVNVEYCSCVDEYKKELICDSDADFKNLPQCATGSTAMSVESGTVMMVNASGQWAVFGG